MNNSATRDAEANEAARLQALARYHILDTPNEAQFDDVVRIAAQICGTPMALISLVDDRRQWFKASLGLDVSETPRGIAFCAHAIQQDEVFVVGNASQDERFVSNPLVTEAPNLRFYAGAPLQTSDGFRLGTLCVLDRMPRQLSADQLEALSALSRQVILQFEFRRALKDNEKLIAEKNAALEEKDLLMKEVDHRVKNSLATVQSLLHLQSRAAADEEAARQLRESAARVQTFGAMHEHLYRVGAATHVDISAYLQSLIDDYQSAFGAAFNDRAIEFDASTAWWPSAEAPVFGMILIELVTNAMKYGAGTVTITLRHKDGKATLTVEDEGRNLPPDFTPAQSKGLGMRIVTGLLRGQNSLRIDRTRGHTCFIATMTVPPSESPRPENSTDERRKTSREAG